MKNEFRWENYDKILTLSVNTYSYSIDEDSRDKTTKGTKKCAIKKPLKFENYENFLEVTQLDNKTKYLGKNNISIDSI